jgi:hypothetical protein
LVFNIYEILELKNPTYKIDQAPGGVRDPALPLGLYQILGGEKSFKTIFLIKVGQNWVIKGGHFSVVNSTYSL